MELEKLQQIIAEVLNVDASEVMPGTTFTEDLGADSLDLYQIILGVLLILRFHRKKQKKS